MNKSLLLLICILTLSTPCLASESRLRPSSWATPVLSENLDNWHKVDDLVYRSEQPDSNGMADIEQFGIRRILNLREFHDDDNETKTTELSTFNIPINAAKIKIVDVVKALKFIKSSDQPILIHCWHGADRTGTMVAMYRIVVQGWTKDAALDELENGGYGYHSIYRNIKEFIINVDVAAIRTQIESP